MGCGLLTSTLGRMTRKKTFLGVPIGLRAEWACPIF